MKIHVKYKHTCPRCGHQWVAYYPETHCEKPRCHAPNPRVERIEVTIEKKEG